MSEERQLAERAWNAIKAANRRLLLIGGALLVLGITIALWWDLRESVWREVPPEPAVEILTTLAGGVVAAVGVALLRAAFGRFDDDGRTQPWFVAITSIPLLGRLILWIVRRSEGDMVNPGGSVSSDDDPFISS